MENFLISVFDQLSKKRKFPDKHTAEMLYNLYSDTLRKIMPYLKKDDNNFIPVLKECKTLLENSSIANPALIYRINNITDSTDETQKHKKKTSKRDKFEYFAHDIILDCDKLGRALGLGGFTIAQKNLMDAVYYHNFRSTTILVAVLTFFVIVAVVILLK